MVYARVDSEWVKYKTEKLDWIISCDNLGKLSDMVC